MRAGKKIVRLSTLILSVMVILALAACGKKQSDSGQEKLIKLGDYWVEIKDVNLTKDDDGKDSIALTLIYTNKGKEPHSYLWTVAARAFQDGTELESNEFNIFTDVENLTTLLDDQMTDVQPEENIELKISFALNDKEEPVEVSFSGLLSNKEHKFTYEPSLLEFVELNDGDTESEVEEEDLSDDDIDEMDLLDSEAVEAIAGQEIKIHDYLIKYKDAFLSKDELGQDTLVVTLDYTNGSDTEDSFTWTISNAGVQGGNLLEENSERMVINSEDGTTLFSEQFAYIDPGKTAEVHLSYALDNTEDPVEVTLADVADDYAKSFTLDLSTLEFKEINR